MFLSSHGTQMSSPGQTEKRLSSDSFSSIKALPTGPHNILEMETELGGQQ